MKPRILVVEDNPLSRELLCDWLETEGYEVTSTADLKSAFAAVRSHQPHAVLLDIQVGGDDGLALATWIRQEPAYREIPVIAVTAHAWQTNSNAFFKAVVTLVFPSPLTSPLFKSNCSYSCVSQQLRLAS